MLGNSIPRISHSLAQTIQEAILLGGPKEIDDVLDLATVDEDFPETLRYGLEALYYFRRAYGKGGECEPSDSESKKRVLEIEALWGRELIESLDYYSAQAEIQSEAI